MQGRGAESRDSCENVRPQIVTLAPFLSPFLPHPITCQAECLAQPLRLRKTGVVIITSEVITDAFNSNILSPAGQRRAIDTMRMFITDIHFRGDDATYLRAMSQDVIKEDLIDGCSWRMSEMWRAVNS